MAGIVFALAAWQAVLLCLLFAVMYVGSLYVWTATVTKDRDHPDTIKRRFISVGIISLLVPPMLWIFSEYQESDQGHGLLSWLGIRFWGFLPALFVPLILTMVLFMGPLALHYIDGVFRLYLEPRYWTNSLSNLIWIRNHIVAPFSEEFIFRACMLPILVPAFGPGTSIFLCPLFFGVAHFHHMIEKVIQGQQEVLEAFKQSVFQLFYTTIFGAYSAFLFLRTGHLMAPVIAHAFCNHMGFPAFSEVMGYQKPTRTKLVTFFVVGMLLWMVVLYPMTSPWLYANAVYSV
ncbi:CAAX prenyl protease 2-like [Haliotis cracherodii]|uniref:CAAX prenyl protease 2-like n=1 Tax=Haliotis cracherodii TaxID=6455 RepID=UPI0039ED6BE5